MNSATRNHQVKAEGGWTIDRSPKHERAGESEQIVSVAGRESPASVREPSRSTPKVQLARRANIYYRGDAVAEWWFLVAGVVAVG